MKPELKAMIEAAIVPANEQWSADVAVLIRNAFLASLHWRGGMSFGRGRSCLAASGAKKATALLSGALRLAPIASTVLRLSPKPAQP